MFASIAKGLWGGTKAIAAGKTQANLGIQSPYLPAAIVRVGRFMFTSTGLWIAVTWYSGYVNARTTPGSGPQLVIGGAASGSVDRPDRTPSFSNGSNVSNGSPQPGETGGAVRMRVARLAQSMVNRRNFTYSETRPYPNSLQSNPCATDCSGFTALVYKGAGAPDPNGTNYNGLGNTDTLQQNGTVVQRPNIGDLAFWKSPDHVAIVVSTGVDPTIVEFGGPPFPSMSTINRETPYHASFIGYRSYL